VFICVASWDRDYDASIVRVTQLQSILCILNGIIPSVSAVPWKVLRWFIRSTFLWDFITGRINNTFSGWTFAAGDTLHSSGEVWQSLALDQEFVPSHPGLPTVAWTLALLLLGYIGMRRKYAQ
jgi:hypothetical protein